METPESLKALLLEMSPDDAVKGICAALEESPELYDGLIDGMDFELEDGEEEDEEGEEEGEEE